MPPFVAEQILSSIYLPDDEAWAVSQIRVLNPIRFIADQIVNARGPRRALFLTDVAYVIEASAACDRSCRHRHEVSFERAVVEKAFVHLGLPALTATVRLATVDDIRADTIRTDLQDLGWMMRELRHPETKLPTFFRAQLVNGCMAIKNTQITAS